MVVPAVPPAGEDGRMAPGHDSAYLQLLIRFDAVPIGIWRYDGGFAEVNDALLELIGCSRADFAAGAIDWRALTPPNYLPLDEDCMRQLESGPVAEPYVKEYIRRTARGSRSACSTAVICTWRGRGSSSSCQFEASCRRELPPVYPLFSQA
jgi:PAS domain-containing protein